MNHNGVMAISVKLVGMNVSRNLKIVMFFTFWLCALGMSLAQDSYIVRSSDTLYSIAQRFNTDVENLKTLNELQTSTIYEGQRLNLPRPVPVVADAPSLRLQASPSGFYVTLQAGETLLTLALRYGVTISELARINNIRDVTQISFGQRIFVPIAPQGGYVPEETIAPSLNQQQLFALKQAGNVLQNFQPPSQHFSWPLALQGRISSTFGYRKLAITKSNYHYGLDIAAPTGTTILAARAGIVSEARWIGGYGNVVYINHIDGTQTRYAHMSAIKVFAGQQVFQGSILGEVGSTGVSTGPHLHFELRIGGYAVDPLNYLNP